MSINMLTMLVRTSIGTFTTHARCLPSAAALDEAVGDRSSLSLRLGL